MSTVSNIASLARKLARTNSNDLPDADVIDYANLCLQTIHKQLIIDGLQSSQLKEATVTLSALVGTFATASDVWILKSAEINWQDTTNQSLWVPMGRVDLANLPAGVSVDWMRKNQPTSDPLIDWRGNVAEVFPTPTTSLPVNTTNQLKYIYWASPTEYAVIGDTVAYPESMDYRMIACYVASTFLDTLSGESAAKLSEVRMKEFLKRFDDFKKLFQQAGQEPVSPGGLNITGYEF